MANFLLRIQANSTSAVINDLGITITGDLGDTYDLSYEQPNDVANSADLVSAISGGSLLVIDPRDGSTELNVADSISAVQHHNSPHFGVIGGKLGTIDSPATVLANDSLIKYDTTSGEFVTTTAADIFSSTAAVNEQQDVIESTVLGGNDVSIVVGAGTGNGDKTLTINVDDSFLRNDANDNITSGNTITVDSGAAIAVATGGSLTITDAPVNGTDAVNKAYADSLASGLDPKESCHIATTADLGATYIPDAGVTNGKFTGAPTTLDNVLVLDTDRILVKDQTDPKQNGIYVVTNAATGEWQRAEDHNGDPANEISGGNFTFIKNGDTFAATGWVLHGNGNLVPNTDDIVWVQFSAAGAYTAGNGLSLNGGEFAIDIASLTDTAATITDLIMFGDADDNDVAKSREFSELFSDLSIPNGVTANGFVVQAGADNWVATSFVASTANDEVGIAITNGDGTAGNVSIGLDIANLAALSDAVDATNDLVPVYNATSGTNEYYTVAQIAGSVSSTDSFVTWTAGGNSTGDANVQADNSADAVIIGGGNGISIDFNSATTTLTYNFTRDGLADTAVVAADTVPFFDSSAANGAAYRSFTDILDDLNIVNDLGGNGFAVQTGTDTYAARTLTASTAAAEQGVVITNGDGVSGDPTVGLDIDNLTDSADALSATDELAMFDGTNNVSLSGQQVADGVGTLLGLGGMAVTAINGQNILTLVDSTRSDKVLSVDSVELMYGENRIADNDWMDIGSAVDADSSYVAPMNGTIVYSTGHSEDTGANGMDMHVYINGVDSGSVGTLTGGANASFHDTTVNLNFSQGDRIRIRAVQSTGTDIIQDTVVSLYIKWRG